jgi:hypothetical protein
MATKSTIIAEIDSKTSHNYFAYRIGITDNAAERKQYWSTTETTKNWQQWLADSPTDAQAIEAHFINDKGMSGRTGGDVSSQTRWVYVF